MTILAQSDAHHSLSTNASEMYKMRPNLTDLLHK